MWSPINKVSQIWDVRNLTSSSLFVTWESGKGIIVIQFRVFWDVYYVFSKGYRIEHDLPVAVWTTSGCFLRPSFGLTMSPNPVTSTTLSFWARKASLSGSGRQMGMVLMLYMSTSSFSTIRDRSWPSRMSLSLEVLSQPGWMMILSTASPVP